MDRTPFYEQVRDRLIRYARVDTQSARVSDTVPTTKKQFDLARMLRDELMTIGAADVWLDEEKCVLYGRVPATAEGGMAFGLVTHMDTAPDAPGANCNPWVLEGYDGGDILLIQQYGRAQYILVAGYVNRGEPAEDAARREIMEETHIRVKNIRYFGSQSWPFPSQLMLAFNADYDGGDINLQAEEIADAQWFDPEHCPASPKPGSIAYRLIEASKRQK